MLVVVCGLPGVGKTTVAGMVADRLGVEPLRTDVVREELFDRARRRLDGGEDAVLDGTFAAAVRRERARELAAEAGVDHRLVKVTCRESTVRERIARRTDDASDADFEVYRAFESAFEPVTAAHTTVDNSGGLEDVRRQVVALL